MHSSAVQYDLVAVSHDFMRERMGRREGVDQ